MKEENQYQITLSESQMMLTFEKTQTLFVINDEADDRAIYLLR